MTSILLESAKIGSSSWVNVRGPRKAVRISGIKAGDQVEIQFMRPSGIERVRVEVDRELKIPPTASRVRAEHTKTNGSSRVSVDLI